MAKKKYSVAFTNYGKLGKSRTDYPRIDFPNRQKRAEFLTLINECKTNMDIHLIEEEAHETRPQTHPQAKRSHQMVRP